MTSATAGRRGGARLGRPRHSRNFPGCIWWMDRREDPKPAAAVLTSQNIELEDFRHQYSPTVIARVRLAGLVWFHSCTRPPREKFRPGNLLPCRYDDGAPLRGWTQTPCVHVPGPRDFYPVLPAGKVLKLAPVSMYRSSDASRMIWTRVPDTGCVVPICTTVPSTEAACKGGRNIAATTMAKMLIRSGDGRVRAASERFFFD